MGERFPGPARWDGGEGKRSVQARETIHARHQPVADEVNATDAAKAHAAEHNIDLAEVTGTGVDGRITKDDVAGHVTGAEAEQQAMLEPIPDEADQA